MKTAWNLIDVGDFFILSIEQLLTKNIIGQYNFLWQVSLSEIKKFETNINENT